VEESTEVLFQGEFPGLAISFTTPPCRICAKSLLLPRGILESQQKRHGYPTIDAQIHAVKPKEKEKNSSQVKYNQKGLTPIHLQTFDRRKGK